MASYPLIGKKTVYIDDMIIHRRTLHEMLDGSYWARTRPR